MKILLYIILATIFAVSCKDPQKKAGINDMSKTININKDSLIKMINQYTKSYFITNSIDSIVALNDKPKYISKIQWGDNKSDSLLIVSYAFLKFNFWVAANSKPELESVYLLDSKITLPGNISVGKTTRQDILKGLGLPDLDHNDPGRSIDKSGDTTVYGTQSGSGDTVTFIYYFKIDECAIGFAMTKDTLRNISWTKNLD
jgi:hypothetical protein